MVYYITYIKDILGQNYLGIKIPNDIINEYIEELKVFEDNYDLFIDNQQKRDNGEYHITVINVADYNRLSKEMGMSTFVNSLDRILNYEIDDLEMLGIGTATKNTNKSYFIVCQSDKLDAIRIRYGLKRHDFHITIGFNPKDIFGVPKNQIIGKNFKLL